MTVCPNFRHSDCILTKLMKRTAFFNVVLNSYIQKLQRGFSESVGIGQTLISARPKEVNVEEHSGHTLIHFKEEVAS